MGDNDEYSDSSGSVKSASSGIKGKSMKLANETKLQLSQEEILEIVGVKSSDKASTKKEDGDKVRNDSKESFINEIKNEIKNVIEEVVSQQTAELMNVIYSLKQEVSTLQQSNIDLIRLLTSKNNPTKTVSGGNVSCNSQALKNNVDGNGGHRVVQKKQPNVSSKGESAPVVVNSSNAGPPQNTPGKSFSDALKHNTGSTLKHDASTEDVGAGTAALAGMNAASDVGKREDEGEFTTVKRRKKTTIRTIHGSSNNAPLKGVPKLCHLHVYRLDPAVTSKDVLEYLQQKGFDSILCESMESKYPDIYSSFKVTCIADQLDAVKDPAIWPRGTCINTFFRWIGKKNVSP